MAAALSEARRAAARAEVPVGAVVVYDGTVIGAASNETKDRRDPMAHAEVLAIQRALEGAKTDRLPEATLYVTLEPCAMCAGAIVLAKIGRLVYGARDDKAGMCGSLGDLVRDERLNHRVEVMFGVRQDECADLLRSFFEERR